MKNKKELKEFDEFKEFVPKCFADGCNKKAKYKYLKYPFVKGGIAGLCEEHYWIKNQLSQFNKFCNNTRKGLQVKSSYNWYDD